MQEVIEKEIKKV